MASTASRTSTDSLAPLWLTRVLRSLASLVRRVKRTVLSISAIRDINDELRFSEFTPAEQVGHETLLADTIRMAAYRDGIQRNVKGGDVVVDLGTGTGILAMIAAQQHPKIVHAIDSSKIVCFAERIAKANGFTNIAFKNISSRRLSLDEPVDVIVHEQIGQALVDEGVIEKTLDLKKRLLRPGGRIVPGRFELFLEPACLKNEFRVPHLWQTNFAGIDFGSVKDSPEIKRFMMSGEDWQVGTRGAVDYFLCDSHPALTFNLNEIAEPAEVPTQVSVSKIVRRGGKMDVFCLYFRVIFDSDVSFDTSPFSPKTSWDNLHFRIEPREFSQGDTLVYSLDMTDRFDFKTWTIQITSPVSRDYSR